MDHAILTRFNLPTAGTAESLIRGRAAVSRVELLSDIEAHVGRKTDWLITTNLDNDDALAADFVERVQSAPRTDGRCAVYLGNGLIRHGGNVYARRDPVNAFCSVREPWVGARSWGSEWHNLLGRTMSIQVLGGSPGWLQVVHGTNVTNRVRGRLTTPAPHRRLFPGALDDALDPPRAAVIRDAALRAPRRWVVNEVRQVGKTAVMRVAGRRGLERVRRALVTLRQR
jgi:hypothetical protein